MSAIATDAVTVGNITFTFTSTPSGETDVEVDGADDTADALALSDAINAHSTLASQVIATSALGGVTVECRTSGLIGNLVAFSSADATITATGSGYLASGAGGATDSEAAYNLGLS